MDWFCHSLLDKADQNLPHELEVLQFTAARKRYYPWYLVDRIQKLLNLHSVFVFCFAFTSNHVAARIVRAFTGLDLYFFYLFYVTINTALKLP